VSVAALSRLRLPPVERLVSNLRSQFGSAARQPRSLFRAGQLLEEAFKAPAAGGIRRPCRPRDGSRKRTHPCSLIAPKKFCRPAAEIHLEFWVLSVGGQRVAPDSSPRRPAHQPGCAGGPGAPPNSAGLTGFPAPAGLPTECWPGLAPPSSIQTNRATAGGFLAW